MHTYIVSTICGNLRETRGETQKSISVTNRRSEGEVYKKTKTVKRLKRAHVSVEWMADVGQRIRLKPRIDASGLLTVKAKRIGLMIAYSEG